MLIALLVLKTIKNLAKKCKINFYLLPEKNETPTSTKYENVVTGDSLLVHFHNAVRIGL